LRPNLGITAIFSKSISRVKLTRDKVKIIFLRELLYIRGTISFIEYVICVLAASCKILIRYRQKNSLCYGLEYSRYQSVNDFFDTYLCSYNLSLEYHSFGVFLTIYRKPETIDPVITLFIKFASANGLTEIFVQSGGVSIPTRNLIPMWNRKMENGKKGRGRD
jgi:hypothetical protein